jgi:hypothetical protein
MEKTKHTPGPWRTDFNSYDNQWRVYEKNGPPIINSLFKPSGEIGEANARLIAAAPDLLEACEVLLKAAPELWGDDIEKWPRLMDRVEAAIAKAEGRE